MQCYELATGLSGKGIWTPKLGMECSKIISLTFMLLRLFVSQTELKPCKIRWALTTSKTEHMIIKITLYIIETYFLVDSYGGEYYIVGRVDCFL